MNPKLQRQKLWVVLHRLISVQSEMPTLLQSHFHTRSTGARGGGDAKSPDLAMVEINFRVMREGTPKLVKAVIVDNGVAPSVPHHDYWTTTTTCFAFTGSARCRLP